MSDRVESEDTRLELDGQGKLLKVAHKTKAVFRSGLAADFLVGDCPAAIVGSSGPNQGEHRQPKQGQTLLPRPTDVAVQSGCDFFLLDDQPGATTGSKVRCPDVQQPTKDGILVSDQDWFLVDDQPLIRGE